MYSHDMLSGFSNDDSISTRLCPYQYDERVLDLQDKLKDEFWRVVDEALTERQGQVIKLIGNGKTQQEVAKAMDCNQSSINKSLHGNGKTQGAVPSYGGSEKKLREACLADPKIIEILNKISEIRAERW